jgi:glycosyltransferase involved in cell wall biosynthesis
LADQLQTGLQQAGFGPQETVLHVHNHSLGKNVALPGALHSLALQGYATLLQIHDFAEDFRPDNYRQLAAAHGESTCDQLTGWLYPQAPQLHYAVLNGRDHSILQDAGVDDARLHLLPNAVADIGPLPPRDEARARLADRYAIPDDHRFLLYPVRGIRRKNIGELLLWSALADRQTSFALTLPPLNPIEQPSYGRWKEFAVAHELPCVFEVGGPAGLAFTENLAAADAIVTTSVAEGFGLVFLESWLVGRPLVGRDLPAITADFARAGIRFAGLQPQLWIPIEWLKENVFRSAIVDAYQDVLASYGQSSPSADALDRQVDALVHDGLVDFGSCSVSMQRQVIQRVADDSGHRDRLLELNPSIAEALTSSTADATLVENNARIVRSQYSLARSGRLLLEIYQRVAGSDRDGELQPLARGQRVLDNFLDLSRFHPLRVES